MLVSLHKPWGNGSCGMLMSQSTLSQLSTKCWLSVNQDVDCESTDQPSTGDALSVHDPPS